MKSDCTEPRKRLVDLSSAEIYRSIHLAKMLADFRPPLSSKLALLGYAYDLQLEIDRRTSTGGDTRPISEFGTWEVRKSIEYAIELAAMCPRLQISKMLAEYISALTQELDSRTSARNNHRQRAAQKKEQDS